MLHQHDYFSSYHHTENLDKNIKILRKRSPTPMSSSYISYDRSNPLTIPDPHICVYQASHSSVCNVHLILDNSNCWCICYFVYFCPTALKYVCLPSRNITAVFLYMCNRDLVYFCPTAPMCVCLQSNCPPAISPLLSQPAWLPLNKYYPPTLPLSMLQSESNLQIML